MHILYTLCILQLICVPPVSSALFSLAGSSSETDNHSKNKTHQEAHTTYNNCTITNGERVTVHKATPAPEQNSAQQRTDTTQITTTTCIRRTTAIPVSNHQRLYGLLCSIIGISATAFLWQQYRAIWHLLQDSKALHQQSADNITTIEQITALMPSQEQIASNPISCFAQFIERLTYERTILYKAQKLAPLLIIIPSRSLAARGERLRRETRKALQRLHAIELRIKELLTAANTVSAAAGKDCPAPTKQ